MDVQRLLHRTSVPRPSFNSSTRRVGSARSSVRTSVRTVARTPGVGRCACAPTDSTFRTRSNSQSQSGDRRAPLTTSRPSENKLLHVFTCGKKKRAVFSAPRWFFRKPHGYPPNHPH